MTPQLRFPEYLGALSPRRLRDFTSYVDYRGKTPTKTESGTLLVTARNIRMGSIDYKTSVEYVDSSQYDLIMRRGKPQLGEVLFTTEAPLGNVAAVDRVNVALAQRVIKFASKDDLAANGYILQMMLGQKFQSVINKKSIGSTVKGIQGKVLHELQVPLPTLAEQQKIADFLTTVDDKITALDKKVELLKQYKKGVMQQIFNQQIRFEDEGGSTYSEWKIRKFDEVLSSVSIKSHQIQSTEYNPSGKFPVVDQGQRLIVGYSDQTDKVFSDVPVIIFGDHTTTLKLISYNFIVGADGTKVLKVKDSNDVHYVYHYLSQNLPKQEGYKRHFSMLQQVKFAMPCKEEQEKIAVFLNTIDDKIVAEQARLSAAKEWKKGLMQRMFV